MFINFTEKMSSDGNGTLRNTVVNDKDTASAAAPLPPFHQPVNFLEYLPGNSPEKKKERRAVSVGANRSTSPSNNDNSMARH